METAFLEYLDGRYWEGYGEVFKEENPRKFQVQLTTFDLCNGFAQVGAAALN